MGHGLGTTVWPVAITGYAVRGNEEKTIKNVVFCVSAKRETLQKTSFFAFQQNEKHCKKRCFLRFSKIAKKVLFIKSQQDCEIDKEQHNA